MFVFKGRRHKVKSIDTEYQLHPGGIQNGRPETGRRNNFALAAGKKAISNADTMFSRVADAMERLPTPNTSCVQVKSSMAVHKPEVEIRLIVIV